MAWESVDWACGHSGSMQLYGKQAGRDSTVAHQAGRKCFACWLLGEWQSKNDPRYNRDDRWDLAVKIAEGKGNRIYGAEIKSTDSPYKAMTDEQLQDQIAKIAEQMHAIADELARRGHGNEIMSGYAELERLQMRGGS